MAAWTGIPAAGVGALPCEQLALMQSGCARKRCKGARQQLCMKACGNLLFMSCTPRSCTQPQHCHSPRSSSCHCVLSETQPDSEDEAADIHGQKFSPVSSFSFACLAASAARGFSSSVAFLFFRQTCRFQHPSFSFSVLPSAHPHILVFSPHHGEAELSQEKQSFTSAPHLVGSLLPCGLADTGKYLRMACLSSNPLFGKLILWKLELWFLCQIRTAHCGANIQDYVQLELHSHLDMLLAYTPSSTWTASHVIQHAKPMVFSHITR